MAAWRVAAYQQRRHGGNGSNNGVKYGSATLADKPCCRACLSWRRMGIKACSMAAAAVAWRSAENSGKILPCALAAAYQWHQRSNSVSAYQLAFMMYVRRVLTACS